MDMAQARPDQFNLHVLDKVRVDAAMQTRIDAMQVLLQNLFSVRFTDVPGNPPALLFNDKNDEGNPYTLTNMGTREYCTPTVYITTKTTKRDKVTGLTVPNSTYLLAAFKYKYDDMARIPGSHKREDMFWRPLGESLFVSSMALPEPLRAYLINGGRDATPDERAALLPPLEWIQSELRRLAAITNNFKAGVMTWQDMFRYCTEYVAPAAN